MEIASSLIGGGLAGGVIATVVVWLFKTWITERLSNAIRHEYDVKMERMRADLHIAASERQIRFSLLHDRVAETLAETYSKLFEIKQSLLGYTNPCQLVPDENTEAKRVRVIEATNAFRSYYQPRRIYLPRPTADMLTEIDKLTTDIATRFELYVEGDGDPTHRTEHWVEQYERLKGELDPALHTLEDDFRKHLGVVSKGSD